MTSRRILLSLLLFVFLFSDPFAQSENKRGPSTREERMKAVQIARALEADPLQPGSKDMRTWFTPWLIEVPDITVQVCGEELGPIFYEKDRDKKFATEMFWPKSFLRCKFRH